jgi:cytidylate kinase
MWKNIGLDKCKSFITSGFLPKGLPDQTPAVPRPAITISRMTGAGGHTVASGLADYLRDRAPAHDEWTIFDQNLVEKTLEDGRIAKRVTAFLEEGHKSMIKDSVEEWIGLHPSHWTLVQGINATMLRLAQVGNVILVGRGSAVITSKLKNVFHVRLVGSLERRIERVEQVHGMDRKSAASYIKKKDDGRKKYLKENFDADIDDFKYYHIVVNTDLVGYDGATRIIGNEVIARFHQDKVRVTDSMTHVLRQ